jgi:hypothetical protein
VGAQTITGTLTVQELLKRWQKKDGSRSRECRTSRAHERVNRSNLNPGRMMAAGVFDGRTAAGLLAVATGRSVFTW